MDTRANLVIRLYQIVPSDPIITFYPSSIEHHQQQPPSKMRGCVRVTDELATICWMRWEQGKGNNGDGDVVDDVGRVDDDDDGGR